MDLKTFSIQGVELSLNPTALFTETIGERQARVLNLNELKDKFDDVVTKLQDSDQYSKLKDQVDNVIVQVNDKINDVREKMSEQEFDDFSDLEDEINDIEDDLNVIIDDLKD